MSASPSSIPRELRSYVRRHNLWVLFLGTLCVFAAFLAWGALYLALQWIGLLALTALQGVDAPQNLNVGGPFLIVSGLLLIVTWIARRASRHRPPRLGRFNWSKVCLDVLLLPGNLTFAGPDTFRAWVSASRPQLEAAWNLLQRLHRSEKLSLHELRTIVPEPEELENVLYLLGITSLTETDEYGGVWYVHLRNDRARHLIRQMIHWREETRNLSVER